MGVNGLPAPLDQWAQQITSLKWSALILDPDWTLRWVSDQLKRFLRSQLDDELGVGKHIAEAFLTESWLKTVHPESQIEMAMRLGPYIRYDFDRRGWDLNRLDVPDMLRPVLEEIEPVEPPDVISWSFQYLGADNESDLPDYRVDACGFRMVDSSGNDVGMIVVTFMGVRPDLLALLARGDEAMYERMARLVEPGPHQAALLFCDMHESGVISRRLPSAAYFKLVRRLWTGIDHVIATETGIVGKHAGDGASAYFLVDDLGDESATVAAAIRAARRIHEVSAEVFREIVDSDCLMKIGVHFAGNLYMGQLVPGSRLDVTALGDEVNEAARIQESIGPGGTLASKALMDQLTPDDASALGIDIEKLRFQTIAELETAPAKAVRDAGGLPVVELS